MQSTKKRITNVLRKEKQSLDQSEMDHNLISIITPVYNGARFVKDTINSVLAQTYTNWELLIVDDMSDDESASIIADFMKHDSRIRYWRNERWMGAALSRNRALREAKGRWIAFLDSDDLWLPDKLEKQIAFMQNNDYAFTYHEYDEIDEESKPLGVHVSGIGKVDKWQMFACCWPGCLTVMYDAEKIGLIQIADIKRNNDTAMWLEIVKKAPCYLLNENLAVYRRRKGSITPESTWGKIKAHYPLFHVAAGMNPIMAWIWTFINIPGNMYKKALYVRKNKR